MPEKVRPSKQAIRQWMDECRAFFDNTAALQAQRNWETLLPMSVLYLAYVCIYLFVVCPFLHIPEQTATVRAFTAAHAVFTLLVFLLRKKTPPVWVVDLAITLFAAQILGLSGFLGVVVFPTEASFLFPLCLVLMTQIYTRRPIHPISEVLIPSAVYLVCCHLTKNTYYFVLDLISVSIAIAIAGAALYSITNYKMQAYRAQTSLQKMCALDPMTGVNNKATFEFLVEEYLRVSAGGGHALALCDLDDFKSINDKYGHRVGDEVLKAFASILHSMVDGDPNMIAGRFGGDEFVLFMKQCGTREEALNKLDRLTSVPGFGFPVRCSIGVAFSTAAKDDFSQIFDAADADLYREKDEKPIPVHTPGTPRP